MPWWFWAVSIDWRMGDKAMNFTFYTMDGFWKVTILLSMPFISGKRQGRRWSKKRRCFGNELPFVCLVTSSSYELALLFMELRIHGWHLCVWSSSGIVEKTKQISSLRFHKVHYRTAALQKGERARNRHTTANNYVKWQQLPIGLEGRWGD